MQFTQSAYTAGAEREASVVLSYRQRVLRVEQMLYE